MFWSKPKHVHAWKVTGVHQLQRVTYLLQQREIVCPVTEVLGVCDCGEVNTCTLDGHWTLEQLQPHPAQPATDAEFFRQMGVKP